jgi:hypothetical protein
MGKACTQMKGFSIHEEKFNKMQQRIKALFPIYVKLNMFRATQRPLSGA